MRISLWPALVCGSMLVATVGNTVFAAPPAAKPSRAVTQADADDEMDDVEDSAGSTRINRCNMSRVGVHRRMAEGLLPMADPVPAVSTPD